MYSFNVKGYIYKIAISFKSLNKIQTWSTGNPYIVELVAIKLVNLSYIGHSLSTLSTRFHVTKYTHVPRMHVTKCFVCSIEKENAVFVWSYNKCIISYSSLFGESRTILLLLLLKSIIISKKLTLLIKRQCISLQSEMCHKWFAFVR